MKNGWPFKTLGEIADIKGGKRVPKGYRLLQEPTKHPYITVSDFTDDGTVDTSQLAYLSDEVFNLIKTYTISSKDLYLSIAGTIGKTGSVPPELDGANLTENACKLVLHSGIEQKFLYYFTKGDDFVKQAASNTRVAAQPKLALERLRTIRLPAPPLPEQQRIVRVLDEAFAALATAQANADKNLQNARALFESHLHSVFSHRGKGWVGRKLHSLCPEITVGYVGPMAKEYTASGVTFLRSQNIRPFQVSLDNALFISRDFDAKIAKSRLRPGDVAVVRTGYPGTAAVIPASLPESNCADLVIVRPGHEVEPQFLAAFFNSAYGKEHVAGKVVGAAQKHFNVGAAKETVLHLPPLQEQRTIIAKFDALAAETQRLARLYEQKQSALAALKKSLLHQAFSGAL